MIFEKKVSFILLFVSMIFLSAISLMNFQFGSSAETTLAYTITTDYYGTNANEIERIITIPIEDAIVDVFGIKQIQSVSEFAKSRITILIKPGVDIDALYSDLKERVDRASSFFPDAVQKTRIMSSDNTNHPLFIVSMKSGSMGIPELGDYVESKIKPIYQRIKGTGEIETGGQGIRDILIKIDNEKAAQSGIDAFAVSRLLQRSNVRLPAGAIKESITETNVFFDSGVIDIEDFRKLHVQTKNGFVYLSDIADVTMQYRGNDQISRINGEERIILYIYSGGNINALSLCNELVNATEELAKQGYTTEIIYNKGQEIFSSIQRMIVSMAISMFSLFVFISFFIANVKARIFLSFSIPLSIYLGIAIITGIKIPIDSSIISGLTIGSGLIIDNYLIINDYIAKNKKSNVKSIAIPLLTGTLTTIIVFLPLLVLKSMSKSIQSVSFAICSMLAVSQLLTFTFIPKPLYHVTRRERGKKPMLSLDNAAERFLHITNFSLGHKKVLGFLYLAIIISIPLLLLFGKKELTPIDDSSIVFVQAEFPSGTTIKEVDTTILPFIAQFKQIYGVKLVESSSKRSNAQISVTFDNEKTTLQEIKKQLDIVTASSTKAQFFVGLDQNTESYKIRVTLTGSDHVFLREKVKEVGKVFSKENWVTGVIYHFKENPPSYAYIPDTALLSVENIYPEMVASVLRWNIQGPVSTKWVFNHEEHDVRINNGYPNTSIYDMGKFPVLLNDGSSSNLENLGAFQTIDEPDRLYRDSRQCSISFTILTKRIGLKTLDQHVNNVIQNIELPAGYGIFPDTTISEAKQNYAMIMVVFLLSIILIYSLLAIQNENFILPFLIISSIPFSAFFPLVTLAILKQPLTAASIIGIIILSGTSVNSFILVLDDLQETTDMALFATTIKTALRKRFTPLFLSCGTSIIAAVPIFFSAKPFSDFPSTLSIIIAIGITGSFIGSFIFLPAIAHIFLKSSKNIEQSRF